MPSIQDQLLKAGLVDKKKSQAIKSEKRKKAKQQPKGQKVVNETQEQIKQAQQQKVEADRDKNRQIQAAAQAKAIQAQIKQLIESNRIEREEGDVAFQFADDNKVKKLYVTELLQAHLSKGRVAIVKGESGYELVPAVVANKISERDAQMVVFLYSDQEQNQVDEDDPYADYQIPDDLMW